MNAGIQARMRWDAVAKPLRSLGRLEDLIAQIADIQGTPDVRIDKRCALIFCGDHGVVREGVSQSGSEVTALVAKSIAEGTGNVNLMADAAQMDVFAVDMGMIASVPGTIDRRTDAGTADMTQGSAMTRAQAEQAVQAGIDLMGDMKERGYQIIVVGEMGIGNTTAAAAITSVLLDLPAETVTGRGAGLSDAGLERKIEAIRRAIQANRPDRDDPLDVLAKLGGFEIAGMVGAYLGGARHGLPAVVDGIVSAAAALTAVRICPGTKGFMLPSHAGRGKMADALMNALGLRPVLDADLALGEGTGGVLLLPLLDMALRVYHGPHTFAALGMKAYTPQGGAL